MKKSMLLCCILFAACVPVFAQISFPDASVQTTAYVPTTVKRVIVTAGGTPTENGTALIAAYGGVGGATATAPVQVVLEPGVFDLGTSRIDLKGNVHLRGSGATVTIIQSSQDNISYGILDCVGTTDDIDIAELTIRHTGTINGLAIYKGIVGSMRLTNVNIDFNASATGTIKGIETYFSSLKLSNVHFNMNCGSAAQNYAIVNNSSVLDIRQCGLYVGGSAGSARGVISFNTAVTVVRNSVIFATTANGSGSAYALERSASDAGKYFFVASTDIEGDDGIILESGPASNGYTLVQCWNASFAAITDVP